VTELEILENCLCHRTRMASRAVTRLYDDTLRPVGLRATQLAVLVAIGSGEVVSISALAKLMGMDRSTLTRNLAPLESCAKSQVCLRCCIACSIFVGLASAWMLPKV
jgi:hypothetical protein